MKIALENSLKREGFEIGERFDALSEYLELLARWNRAYNLVGLRSPRDIIDKLILESIVVERFIKKNSYVMDFGTGAGIPGIPLKIVRPDIKLDLVERRKKKVAFLVYVIKKLRLDGVNVVERDVRGGEMDMLSRYDVVLTRGVGKPWEVFSIVKDFLKKDGLFIAFAAERESTDAIELKRGKVHLFVRSIK